ncbi:MAG: hypothetical protein D6820_04865, partial [Lentisphaerae bacterium]
FIVNECGGKALDGGLIRIDGSLNPAYHALRRLLKETWNTQIQDVTDMEGRVRFRGYYGRYRIECEGQTQDVDLTEEGEKTVILPS